MEFNAIFSDFDYYGWVILPSIIFVSRVSDVSLGTLRHVFISKGYRNIVPFLGFIEVLIWIIVVAQIMQNLNNVACYLAWAGGFAFGTYVGLRIEEYLALGVQVVRVITPQDCTELTQKLRSENHGITIVDAHGAIGPVKMLYIIVQRKNVPEIVKMIEMCNPSAFYSIEDIRNANQGVFSPRKSNLENIRKRFPSWKSK